MCVCFMCCFGFICSCIDWEQGRRLKLTDSVNSSCMFDMVCWTKLYYLADDTHNSSTASVTCHTGSLVVLWCPDLEILAVAWHLELRCETCGSGRNERQSSILEMLFQRRIPFTWQYLKMQKTCYKVPPTHPPPQNELISGQICLMNTCSSTAIWEKSIWNIRRKTVQ